MSNTDKIATQGENEEVITTVETDSDRFKKLCDIAGLTYSQMMACKYLRITCKDFGFIEVEAKYNAIGELNKDDFE